MQETGVQSLAREDPLEEEITTYSRILAWEILWREEPGGLQSMRSQRVRHDWARTHMCINTYLISTILSSRFSGWRQILWVVVYPLLRRTKYVMLVYVEQVKLELDVMTNTFLRGPSQFWINSIWRRLACLISNSRRWLRKTPARIEVALQRSQVLR